MVIPLILSQLLSSGFTSNFGFINHYYASSLPLVYYSSGLLTWSFLISYWFLVTTHY